MNTPGTRKAAKRWLSALVPVVGLAAAGVADPALAENRPNVLLIVSDDQGYGDFGFTGNADIRTPHLDRLASESAIFRNFVVAPACSPTRGSLMTGRNHLKAGVWGVGPRNNLLRDEVLMPAFFKSAGYRTGYFGKRDGVSLLELNAWDRGCDEAASVWGYDHHNPRMITQDGVKEVQGWTCDIDVDHALDFIRRQGDTPWWCAVAFIIPHLPWEPDDRFAAPYRERGLSRTLADCYGSIAQMDDAIGRLLAGLATAGREKDTIIIFLSDNGPSDKGLSEADWRSRNPAGLCGGKASAWENGIRVPLLVRWPGRVAPGDRNAFGSVEDILPTLLDLAGVEASGRPEHHPFDGISLRGSLDDPSAPGPDRTVFRVAISGEGAVGGRRAVVNDPSALPMEEHHVTLRGPRFKYHSLAGGATMLYDLAVDPGETTDVSGLHPAVTAAYARRCREEYEAIVRGGRALRMPIVKVGPRAPGFNRVEAVMARRIEGNLRGAGFEGLVGFDRAGQSAEYRVGFLQAGRFGVTVEGQRLDRAAGWRLSIAGVPLALVESDAGKLVFAPTDVDAGETVVILGVEATSSAGRERPMVTRLSLATEAAVSATVE